MSLRRFFRVPTTEIKKTVFQCTLLSGGLCSAVLVVSQDNGGIFAVRYFVAVLAVGTGDIMALLCLQ